MLALATLLLTLSQTGPDLVVDVSKEMADLAVLTDGKGHYLAYNAKAPTSGPTFYGDGKTFHFLHVVSISVDGVDSWSMSFWDPRVQRQYQENASFSMADEGRVYEVACGVGKNMLTRLAAPEAAKLLEAATFRGSLWTRRPEHLFRDDTGVYYLVDRLRTDSPERRDWRVFIGPRGKMKLASLKDVVDDDQGQIFATKDGSLRLVTSGDESKWLKGKVTTPLTRVDLSSPRNARMLYVDLGPYTGEKLGTPCDDLL
ncbi:MAG: hypothetical protein INH41_02190 [Myxococcaceae bacterium]|jgi:hypothetical protein|nr:hypothetical protein [Myxococcaceae bacterium]